MRRTAIAVIALSVFGMAGVLAQNPPPQSLEYDAFCKLPTNEARRAALEKLPQDNLSKIGLVHYERFLAVNRTRLTPQQISFLDRSIALLTRDVQGNPVVDRENIVRFLGQSQTALFSPADQDTLGYVKGCIAKPK